MKALKITVFLLAVLVLTTQFVRHIYVRYLEPRSSVLDTYEQTETKKAIKGAASLDELVSRYDAAKKRIDELDKQRKKAEANKSKDDRDVLRDKFGEEHKEDYERESDLKAAIQEWEQRSREIYELRVFWLFGFAFFLAGAILLVKGREWPGMAFIVSGIVETIWWTSPSFRFAGSPLEFERLLMNKLVFTVITLGLIIAAWVMQERVPKRVRTRR
ncbi:MAG: hypothetical protein AABZ10_09590 [Nitrospirota bacterium]